MKSSDGMGDGPVCPEAPEHGRLYTLATTIHEAPRVTGYLWCAVSQAIFAPSYIVGSMLVAGELVRKGTWNGDSARGTGVAVNANGDLAGHD